jgi:hypothetical protein
LSSSGGEESEGEEIEEGVRKAVERCKVVVNLAGPFSTQNAEVLIRCVTVLCVWFRLLLLLRLRLLLCLLFVVISGMNLVEQTPTGIPL